MTTKQVLSLSMEKLLKMNTKDISKALNIIASTANKRISRLQTKNMPTPAYKGVMQSGGKISYATKFGKNRNAVMKEFYRARQFLMNKTSTVKGAKEVAKTFLERLGIDEMPSTDEQRTAWDIITKMKELNPSGITSMGSDRFQSYIFSMVKDGKSADEIMSQAQDLIQQEYEQREGVDYGDDFFDFGGNT